MSDIWSQAQERIEKEISHQNYETWIRPVGIVSVDGQSVVLGVPNKFFKDWLIDHYREVITRSLSDVMGRKDVAISFMIENGKAGRPDDTDAGQRPERPEPVVSGDSKVPASRRSTLNPKYKFDSFVVGPSNQFAHAAAMAVAENPGRAYNPLFIYGGVGLGKTHLLNAICADVYDRNPRAKYMFLTSEEFTNELISAIHQNRMGDFRNKYRSVDLLVIDDIQFIAGKERTQEEFFHTFNTLHEEFKQIVLSSDRVPKEMPDMEERLRSRFEWGLIADIQPPDLETKAAIVESKARSEGIEIPNEVAMFIANNIKSNIRELEGSLIRLGAYASLTGLSIDLSLARQVLKDVITERDQTMGIDQIIKLVCDNFNIKVSDIKSKRRTRNLVEPRQIAMYICQKAAGASLPEIGRAFGGKDHTTVLHATRQVEQKRQNDIKYEAMVDSLMKAAKGG